MAAHISLSWPPLCVEIGANFFLKLSSRTQFAKINNKKVIAEIQCEKHKKTRVENSSKIHFDFHYFSS